MVGRQSQLLLGTALLLAVVIMSMAFDSRGYRLWRQLGSDVAQLDARNVDLAARIAVQEKKAVALRAESQLVARADATRKMALPRESAQTLERAAHENGYIFPDETLFQLK